MSGPGPLPLRPGQHKRRTYSVPSCCYHDVPACGTKQPKTKPSDTWARINPLNCSLRFSGRGIGKLTNVVLCSEYIFKTILQLNINQKNMNISRKIIWIGILQGWEMYIHSQHHHWSLRRWKSLHGCNKLVYCDLPAVYEGEMTPPHTHTQTHVFEHSNTSWWLCFTRLWNLEVKHCWEEVWKVWNPAPLAQSYGCEQLPYASVAMSSPTWRKLSLQTGSLNKPFSK